MIKFRRVANNVIIKSHEFIEKFCSDRSFSQKITMDTWTRAQSMHINVF